MAVVSLVVRGGSRSTPTVNPRTSFPSDAVCRSEILSPFPGAHAEVILGAVAKLVTGRVSLRWWIDFFAVRLPETRSVSESRDGGRSDRSGNRVFLPRERQGSQCG
jgi:hypothetical protein